MPKSSTKGATETLKEEKAKRTSKRKNNLYFQQPIEANSKKKKSSITSQNMSKRKEESEPTNIIDLSCNQKEMNNDLDEPETMNALQETQTPASSVGNTCASTEISNLTDSQICSLSGNSIEKSTILYEEGPVHLTDKDFIQQQILFLSTPFTLQDCPKLVHLQGNKASRKGHIPEDVIQNSLRKLNHRMDDEIQKHLNRQCQRKVLGGLFDIEKEISENNEQDDQDKTTLKETMDISEWKTFWDIIKAQEMNKILTHLQILRACPDNWQSEEEDDNLLRQYSDILEELKQTDAELMKTKEKIISSKSNSHLISEVECLAKECTLNPLNIEMDRTSQLVHQIVKVFHMQANAT